jgi:uncharacterized protein YicC (UPF0701 family)
MSNKAMTEHEGILTWRALALQERERANETAATANRVIAMLEERIHELESCREAEVAQARYERAEARVVELEDALDAVAALLGMAEAGAKGTISLDELRRRIESLQYCATCAHWSAEDNQCAADPTGSRSWYCSTYSYCRYTPSRWQPRSVS